MSKKSRRSGHVKRRKARRGVPVSAHQASTASQGATVPASKPPSTPAAAPSATPRNISQHSQVAKDLKRIGIIAGAMLIILVMLTLVLS